MKFSIPAQRLHFYAWISMAYMLLWMIGDTANYPDLFLQIILNNIWRGLYILILNFIFFEYALRFALRRKFILSKILLTLVFVFILSMFFSFGLHGWQNLGNYLHVFEGLNPTDVSRVSHAAAYGICSGLFFGIARHLYDYRNLQIATQQLRIEKQVAELNYLKSQTNPHFLFNTLNNIYSLSRDKSDLAPESILQLSKILRFMLYETGGAFISIGQEIKIISDYISLEKLRYDESLRVNFNDDIEDSNQSIPPLLLIPLVENAFKHGAAETRLQPFVDIHLSVRQQLLRFTVRNSTNPSEETRVKESIGLKNLRRQLELLFREYKLSVQQEGDIFTAVLEINLASHV